jgi:type III secretory pathway component EscR
MSLLLTIFVMMPVARDVIAAVQPVRGATSPTPAPLPPGVPTPSIRMPGTATPGEPASTSTAPGINPLGFDLDHPPPDGWLATLERGATPVRAFLARHTHERDRATFTKVATDLRGGPVADDDLSVLSVAFVTSELTEAFAIAFLVFLPFLLIDLIVSVSLGALGLTSVQPSTVALPMKLLLFVAVDGWRLLFEGLLRGYA